MLAHNILIILVSISILSSYQPGRITYAMVCRILHFFTIITAQSSSAK